MIMQKINTNVRFLPAPFLPKIRTGSSPIKVHPIATNDTTFLIDATTLV